MIRSGGKIGSRVRLIEKKPAADKSALPDRADGQERMVEHPEPIRGDEDDGQRKSNGEIGHGSFVIERDEPSPGPFDDDELVPVREFVKGGADHGKIDGAGNRRGCRSERLGQGEGIDHFESESRLVTARGFEDGEGIFLSAALDRLHPDGVDARSAEFLNETGRHPGFSDTGIGPGDENSSTVHAPISLRMSSAMASASRLM